MALLYEDEVLWGSVRGYCFRLRSVSLSLSLSLIYDTLLTATFSGIYSNLAHNSVFFTWYMSTKAVSYHHMLDVYIIEALKYKYLCIISSSNGVALVLDKELSLQHSIVGEGFLWPG